MVKQSGILSKALVVGVIVLFIGVGIQPAIAKVQPDIIDFKLNDLDKEELTVEVNEILQKYGHIPMVSYFCDILANKTGIYTWMYILLYVIAVGIGLFLYALLMFYYYYY